MKPVLGIGWDVGGWMGKKQGVAVARWEPDNGGIEWLGTPTSFKLPKGGLPGSKVLLPGANLDTGLLDEHHVIIAIDAPLGFPVAFAEFLAGWPFGETSAPGPAVPPDREIDNRLAYRETDRHIYDTFRVVNDGKPTKTGKKPLSATFDKLGNNATVAISHIRSWRAQHGFLVHPMDAAADGDRSVIEVYPALVKEKREGKKGESAQRWFRDLMGKIPEGVAEGTDEFDAAICATLAVCFAAQGRGGLPKILGPEDVDGLDLAAVRREGWIYYLAGCNFRLQFDGGRHTP